MNNIQTIDRLIHIDALVTVYNSIRPKGFYFPGESHNFWECEYIQEGMVTATADERVYQLGAGKLLIHSPMEFHRAWADKNCAPWIVNISFLAHGELTQKLAGQCFDLRPEQQKEFIEIAETFKRAKNINFAENHYAYRAALARTAALLEAFLIDLADNEKYSSPALSLNDQRYSSIVQAMKANCHKNLSLDELAQLCQMSVSNMKRIFRMYSDVGIAKYYLTLRIRYAMELLENGEQANHIAEIMNFSDPAYFYTVFKRETGMTPAQYRDRKVLQ